MPLEPATPKRARETQRTARVSDVRSPPKKRLKEGGDSDESSDEPDGPSRAPDPVPPRVRADPPPAPAPAPTPAPEAAPEPASAPASAPAPVPAPPASRVVGVSAVEHSDGDGDDTDGGVAAIAARAHRARQRTLLSAEQKRKRFQERYRGVTAQETLGTCVSGSSEPSRR